MTRESVTEHKVTDEEITRLVREAIAWGREAHYAEVDISVDGGIVFLTGRVESPGEKTGAEKAAYQAPGVTQVINNIMVMPSRVVDDNEIRSNVEATLKNDPRTNANHFEVQVNNAVVTLRGEVLVDAEKWAAIDNASLVMGVKDVNDEITVLPANPDNDHMLEELVNAELARAANVDEKHINARVVRGIVYLRGSAVFDVERSAAERAAKDVPGVSGVINEIRLEEAA